MLTVDDILDLPWATETVHIIGGGPSASRVNMGTLDGLVVGVNDSAVYAHCDVAFSASPNWMRQRREFLEDFPGGVVLASVYGPRGGDRCRVRRPVLGVPLPFDIRHARRPDHNSGHEALRWVASMSARTIVLIGFDMDPAEPMNWHPGYEWMPDKSADPMFDFGAWVSAFDATARALDARGVAVWNANPESMLRCFPFLEDQCVS